MAILTAHGIFDPHPRSNDQEARAAFSVFSGQHEPRNGSVFSFQCSVFSKKSASELASASA